MLTAINYTILRKFFVPSLVMLCINLAVLYLHVHEGTLIFSLSMGVALTILFIVQNVVYAISLFGPQNHQNLFKQLSVGKNTLLITLPAYIILTSTVQLAPLLSYFCIFGIDHVAALSIDLFAAVIVWSLAIVGYLLGIIAVQWRHWSFALILFAFVYLFSVLEQGVIAQVWVIGGLLAFAAMLLCAGDSAKKYLISIPMALGAFIAISGVLSTVMMVSDNANWRKSYAEVRAVLSERGTKLQSDSTSTARLEKQPQALITMNYDYRLNWFSHEIAATNPEQSVRAKEMTNVWQTHGEAQDMVMTYSFLGQPVMVFDNGIYQIDNESGARMLWERGDKGPVQWMGKFRQLTGTDIVMFGGDDYLAWVHWDVNDEASTGTMNVTGNVRYAAIANFVNDPSQFTLVLNTDMQRQFVYEWQDFTQSPILIETNELAIDYANEFRIQSLISTPLAWIDNTFRAGWPQTSGTNLFYLLSHLLAVIAAVLYYLSDSMRDKAIKAACVAVLGWPALIALMVCFKRKKVVDWEANNLPQPAAS